MNKCNVQFYCPPMRINRYPDGGFMCHRTDAEPMVCTVTMDGRKVCPQCSPVTIPPTLSRPTGLMEWTVDACVGEGSDGPECDKCGGVGELSEDDFDGRTYHRAACKKCNGFGVLGNRVRVELPKERVAFKWIKNGQFITARSLDNLGLPFALIAEPIDAVCTLWLADGRIFRTDPNVPDSYVNFGECKVIDPLFNPTAEALTTTKGNLVAVTDARTNK